MSFLEDLFGGGDDPTTTSTVRYAPYVEEKHENFLDRAQYFSLLLERDSPYLFYQEIPVNVAFFGESYSIASFPSLYDMYGKFMAGLDIEVLYTQDFATVVESPQVNSLVAAEAALLDDDIDTNVTPRFELGARDVNSSMSSSFIIGKSVIADARVKSISKFSAELKYNLIPIAAEVWKSHLTWNATVIDKYMEVMKLFFMSKMDVDGYNYNLAAKDKLWPFTVLDQERACIGALQGAKSTSTTTDDGSSGLSTVLGIASGLLSVFN